MVVQYSESDTGSSKPSLPRVEAFWKGGRRSRSCVTVEQAEDPAERDLTCCGTVLSC